MGSLRRVSDGRILTLLLSTTLLLGIASCKGKKPRKSRPRNACSAASLKETRRWLAELCAAHDDKLQSPNHHWWGLPLARANVVLRRTLPRGVLLTLTPHRLLINGRSAPDWPKAPQWTPPDMSRGAGVVISRLLPRLRQTLGASARSAAARLTLEDLRRRASPGAEARATPPPSRPPQPSVPSPPQATDLPTGLTVFTLITAKRQLGGRPPWLAHLAIGPRVNLRQVVQLQALLTLAGFDGVHLLFTPRTAPDPPSPPARRIFDAFGTIGPRGDSRARRAARLRALRQEEQRWEQQGCKAMTHLRATLARTPPARFCTVLQDRLPDVLRRCQCPLDERPLLSTWLAVLSPMDHVGSKMVRLHPRSRPLRARANAIWSEIADRVVAHPGQHLWLQLTQ